jgi:protein ImuA
VGHPRWNVELLRIRNGKPGQWQVEWSDGCFRITEPDIIVSLPAIAMLKTGSYG